MNFFNLLLLLSSPACTIFCAQINDPGWTALSPQLTDVPRHLGWTRGFIITSLAHAGDFGVTLPVYSVALVGLGGFTSPHRPCYVVTSECRALCSITSGLAWGLGPRPAVSSDRVINAEHINQLSRFHAQSFKISNFVRSDQSLYFLAKSGL